jgi:O-antigen/teichoic acid export membrane protein
MFTMSLAGRQYRMGISKLSKQILTYAPGSLLPAVFGLLSTALFTRLLGAYEFGQYSLVMGIAMLVTALSVQWLQQSVSRYLPAYLDMEEKTSLKGSFVLSLSVVFVVVLLLAAIMFPAVSYWLPSWKPYYFTGLLFVLCSLLYNPLLVIFQAELLAREYSIFAICNAFLKLFIGLGIVYFVAPKGYGVILGAGLSLVILLPLMWKKAGLASPLSFLSVKAFHSNRQEIERYVGYGLPMLAWFLAENILNTGDRYIIQWFRGSSEVGIYSANYSLVTGAVSLMTAPVLLAAHPFLMKSWAAGDREETGKWLSSITEWFVNAGLILIGLVWLFSSDISSLLLGKEFHQGHMIMPIVMAGTILWQMAQYVQKPLEFAAKTGLMMKLALTAAFVGVILDIILVPLFGYVAAAWVTSASYLLYSALAGYAGKRILPWRIRWPVVMRNALLAAVIFAASGSMRMLVEDKFGYGAGLVSAVFWCLLLLAIAAYFSQNFKLLWNNRL